MKERREGRMKDGGEMKDETGRQERSEETAEKEGRKMQIGMEGEGNEGDKKVYKEKGNKDKVVSSGD